MGRGTEATELMQNGVRYLSIRGAATEARVSRRTIYNWMDDGKIKFATSVSGKRWIVADSLLLKFEPFVGVA